MKNTDTRVRYTKDVLQKALIKKLKEKSINQITVKELCDEAEINRGTFYLHYSTPNDVLIEIENKFIEENFYSFNTYMEESSTNRTPTTINNLQQLFISTMRNIELFKVLIGPNGNYKFAERIKRNFKKDIINSWATEFPEYKLEHLEYIYDYVISGSMSLVLNWIDDDSKTKLTPEQLANRLDRLGHYAHLAIKEFI